MAHYRVSRLLSPGFVLSVNNCRRYAKAIEALARLQDLKEDVFPLRPDGNVGRPRNSFMLIRQAFSKVKTQYKIKLLGSASAIFSRMWKALPEEIRKYWMEKAAFIDRTFKTRFPNYKFIPKSAAEKAKLKEQQETEVEDSDSEEEDSTLTSPFSSIRELPSFALPPITESSPSSTFANDNFPPYHALPTLSLFHLASADHLPSPASSSALTADAMPVLHQASSFIYPETKCMAYDGSFVTSPNSPSHSTTFGTQGSGKELPFTQGWPSFSHNELMPRNSEANLVRFNPMSSGGIGFSNFHDSRTQSSGRLFSAPAPPFEFDMGYSLLTSDMPRAELQSQSHGGYVSQEGLVPYSNSKSSPKDDKVPFISQYMRGASHGLMTGPTRVSLSNVNRGAVDSFIFPSLLDPVVPQSQHQVQRQSSYQASDTDFFEAAVENLDAPSIPTSVVDINTPTSESRKEHGWDLN